MYRPPVNSLTLIQTPGLGNRLLILAKAVVLSRAIDKSLFVEWKRNSGLNCPYHEIYEDSDAFAVVRLDRDPLSGYRSSPTPCGGHVWRRTWKQYCLDTFFPQRDSYRFDLCYTRVRSLPISLKRLARKKRILLNRSIFSSGEDLNLLAKWWTQDIRRYRFLPLRQELRQRVDELSASFKGTRVVGVHIRRGDIPRGRYSGTEFFVMHMKEEIQRDGEVRFFLATDSLAERQLLHKEFGDRLIFQPIPDEMLQKSGTRNTVEGVQFGVVDLYALSRTDKIIGSNSGFSTVAAQMGGAKHYRPA